LERKVDPAAFETAMRQEVVPECLHTPVCAVDRAAIEEFVGNIVQVYGRESAYLVQRYEPAPPDFRLPIWNEPNVERIHEQLQVWVRTKYSRYRYAFRQLRPDVQIDGKVLHHIINRRYAKKCGFEYIRLAPIRRETNSSSAFSEDWGVNLEGWSPGYFDKQKARGYRVKYAGTDAILAMMDVELGGGIMDVARLAQDLFDVPGARRPQASF
jgi:hypothetical protein